MTIAIGEASQELCDFLRQSGIDASAYQAAQVPSITALLLRQPEISNIVLLPGEDRAWSLGHILAAAKQLQGKGRMIFMGAGRQLPSLISVVPDKDALLRLLQKPTKPAGGSNGGLTARQVPQPPEEQPMLTIEPMTVPPEKILVLGVVGSQHRIGCTTQAVGLWHYCKALGFDPAVVATPGQIAQIAGPMHSQEIDGGYLIEGIPFVTDTAQTYDCYILDFGPGSVQEALRATDCLVLVAGIKPWELQNTAAALRAARGKDMVVLLSFSSKNDAQALQPLFGQQIPAALPWMPELWKASVEALAVYEAVLRPVLEQVLAREEAQPESEQQLPPDTFEH